MGQLRRWRSLADNRGQAALMQLILDESGYVAMLEADRSPEAAGRLENLAELMRAMEGFADLQSFLEHVALVMENDRADAADKVVLMTLHAAKGLEFDHLFLPGWEEGLFPSQRALEENGQAALEEERRLAYVGITRARRRATILHAANRRVYGQWTAAIPSRFVAELPAAHVEAESTLPSGGGWREAAVRPGFPAAAAAAGGVPGREGAQSLASLRRSTPGPGPSPARPRPATGPRTDIATGSRVFHTKFGMGTVTARDGNKLEVAFDTAGTRMLLDSYVEPK
jgi:DNA helicase-2/ATP-dependent DNA helicase PcrA